MREQAFVLAALVAILVCPAWAIRPENPPGQIRYLTGEDPAAVSVPVHVGAAAALQPTAAEAPRSSAVIGAYRRLVQSTGRNWSVRWNHATNTPHLVTARPCVLGDGRKLTTANIEHICRDFIYDNADFLGAGSAELQLAGAVRAGGRWFVGFRQLHKGVPVLGGRLRMSFTPDDRLVTFGSDLYPAVAVDTEPNLDPARALSVALADCEHVTGRDRATDPELVVLPLRRPQGFAYHLCWRLYLPEPEVHKKWQYLIDAHTGRIVGKSNALVYQSVTGTARLHYKPEFAADPVQIGPFSYGDITAHGPEVVIASWDFDTDPGWTTEGDWAFGVPAATGSVSCQDPNSAYTGSNVYGYNLDGRYRNNIPPYHLTTTPIDCSGFDNVHLKFMRWLSVDSSVADTAAVEVSNDGLNFSTVWTNPPTWLCDDGWVPVSYDISDVAAGSSSVYIRWVMGPTDEIIAFGGWNIDDVQLVSYLGGFAHARTDLDGSYDVPAPWQPFTLISRLQGPYCRVLYDCGPEALFRRCCLYPGQTADFTWDADSYNELVESNAYRHINYVHDYYTYMDPNLREPSDSFESGLDYPMQVTVQQNCDSGFCNAYWDGRAIVLGAGDGIRCDDFALYSEVIYHEYGHAVTSKIYDGAALPYAMEPGALNESWSDYFACLLSPSQNPLVGDGGLLLGSPEGFRTLDNTLRRDTDYFDEVHADSQMVSAALWRIREAMSRKGRADRWDRTVHFARYAHPQTFEEFLLALLTEHDAHYGDGDIANGTPDADRIYTAFGDHGIGGLQYLPESIVVDDSNGNMNGKLDPGETVRLSLSLTNGWADAARVSARLFSRDPFVKIKSPTADFDDVPHGGVTDNAARPFVLSLDAGCPPTHTINFELDVSADGPYVYSRTCLFTYAVAVGQLACDDGQVDNAYLGYGRSGGALAVRMTPDRYPAYLTHVRLFPTPNVQSAITVKLWDDDGPDGTPQTPLAEFDVDIDGEGDWFDVTIPSSPLRIDSGSFYVGWVEGSTKYHNGLDKDPPYYYRTWAYVTSLKEWIALTDLGYLVNLMVRVRCLYDLGEGPVHNTTTGKRYTTIQQAIEQAYPGDEIVVDEGTYYENVDFLGKALALRSTEPGDDRCVAATVINGGAAAAAVTFAAGEDQNSILRGFTITGTGRTGDDLPGVSCVGLQMSGPTIADCIITANTGAGIRCLAASPTIVNCLLDSNGRDGVELRSGSSPKILNCLIVDNARHGVFGAYPHIRNCTIAANARAGVFSSRSEIINSIIWGNLGSQIKGKTDAAYCNIQGGRHGLGNIDVDPCFVDPAAGDYHLKSAGWRWDRTREQWTWDDVTSRCIDAGNPGSDLAMEPLVLDVDPLGRFAHNQRVNIGAYGRTEQAAMSPYNWAILADLDNNGTVDGKDIELWTPNWLGTGQDLIADLDRNEAVDLADFALLAIDWLSQTTWYR